MRDQAVTTGMTTRSGSRGHVMVDLFHGWSTEPCSSTSPEQNNFNSSRSDRSSSQQGPTPSSIDAAPTFQAIHFPQRDTSFAASLYTGSKQPDELEKEELERIKRLPPSKRPGVSHAKKTPPNHIKRPRNAYIIFRSHTVSQKLIPKEVENDHRNISRIIAHMWKSLAPEDRAYYEQIAKEEKERHKAMFPNYRYQPTTRRAEVNKRNVKKLENGDEECQEIADIILKAQGKDGVVVRSEPAKPLKRAREATRSASSARTSAPRRKKIKVEETKKVEPATPSGSADQMLETVFLHPSPTSSPLSSAGSDAGFGSVAAPLPEPFRLESCTPSNDQGPESPLRDTSPIMLEHFGRRASSAPILRPCSPPPSFTHVPAESVEEQQTSSTTLGANGVELESNVAPTQLDYSDHATMPAPSWKGRKALPPPIPNTWQLCSYDDQSLPSPRTVDGFGSANKGAANRPRTAWPSTPSSGTFRGFFHPWAFEHANESMLVSPMTASFQDLRRRSSLARSGLVSSRRPGSFGLDAHQESGGRMEMVEGSHGLLPTSDLRMSEDQLFADAARPADRRLDAEAGTAVHVEGTTFAFDPALEGEGCEPAGDSLRHQPSHAGDHAPQYPFTAPRFNLDSPRSSFSGSTLAAAARDWASMKRRRSRMTHPTLSHAEALPSMGTQNSYLPIDYSLGKPRRYKSSLEESVERAVLLALGKENGQNGTDRGEQSSKIVQQILTSLSAELASQQQQQGQLQVQAAST